MIREPITGGAAYMEAEALGALLARGHVAESYRVAVEPTAALEPVSRALARALADRGITVTGITTRGRASAAQGGHVAVLVAALGFIAVVMTVVGLLGLSSSLGVAVAERTRELGVLRAIGATPGQVQRMVVFEGVALAGVSWVGAVAVSTILSGVVARVLASISAQPLAPRQSVVASALWLVVVLGGAALVSVVPARRAARMSVREAVATA
jgi:putative ABC transport system permease protein